MVGQSRAKACRLPMGELSILVPSVRLQGDVPWEWTCAVLQLIGITPEDAG